MWPMLGSRLVPAGLSGSGGADWPDGVAMPWHLRNAGLGGLGPERTGTRGHRGSPEPAGIAAAEPAGIAAARNPRACGSAEPAGLRLPGLACARRPGPRQLAGPTAAGRATRTPRIAPRR